MKKIIVIVAVLFFVSCNNAGNDQAAKPDTTSSLPAPASIDTNRMKTDSPDAEKALRK